MSLVLLSVMILHVAQGTRPKSEDGSVSLEGFEMRPHEADTYADNRSVARIWDSIWGRLFMPITTLWIYALSTGQGFTAYVASQRFIVDNLSPASYNCFLFHQV